MNLPNYVVGYEHSANIEVALKIGRLEDRIRFNYGLYQSGQPRAYRVRVLKLSCLEQRYFNKSLTAIRWKNNVSFIVLMRKSILLSSGCYNVGFNS